MQTTLSAGVSRVEIWGSGAEVQGFVKNFLGEDGRSGFGRVSIQEESMGDVFGSRHEIPDVSRRNLFEISL